MGKAPVALRLFYTTIGCDTMEKPLISVIVPVYNGEQWIESCCRSVFSQDYPNWELIVVNDGSTDDTLSLARMLAQSWKKVTVLSRENGGVSSARNFGMDLAKGELIAFLDADDLLLPNALSVLYALMLRYDCQMAVGHKTIVKKDGTKTACHFPDPEVLWQGEDGLVKSLEDHPATYSVWGKLYRRELVEDIRFVEGRRVHEDSYFIFQCMLKRPRVVVADAQVLLYRETENSASRGAFSEKIFDVLFFADEKYRTIWEYYPQYLDKAKNMLLKAHMALLRNLCKTNDRCYRKTEKESLQAVYRYAEFYVRGSDYDRRWFWILKHRLYWIYKTYYHLRYGKLH